MGTETAYTLLRPVENLEYDKHLFLLERIFFSLAYMGFDCGQG